MTLDDVDPIQLGMRRPVGYQLHDFPAALAALTEQGLVEMLPDDRRFRITEKFPFPPQQVSVGVPASMARLLARHRDDAVAMSSAYIQQYVIENGLRDLIARALGGKAAQWWQLLPSRVQDNAKARFAGGLKKPRYSPAPKTWDELSPEEKLKYTSFPELRDIVATSWPDFKDWLPSEWKEEAFIAKLQELDPLRDDIGHVRLLSAEDRERLDVQARDIATALERAK
jgi:hypothetical protein